MQFNYLFLYCSFCDIDILKNIPSEWPISSKKISQIKSFKLIHYHIHINRSIWDHWISHIRRNIQCIESFHDGFHIEKEIWHPVVKPSPMGFKGFEKWMCPFAVSRSFIQRKFKVEESIMLPWRLVPENSYCNIFIPIGKIGFGMWWIRLFFVNLRAMFCKQ